MSRLQMIPERLSPAAEEGPFAVYDRRLATKKQKEEAVSAVKGMLERKEKILPASLYRVILFRFRLLADAFSEMLRNIIFLFSCCR